MSIRRRLTKRSHRKRPRSRMLRKALCRRAVMHLIPIMTLLEIVRLALHTHYFEDR